MRPAQNKIIPILIIWVTAIGLLLSIFFLIQIWRLRQPVTDKLRSAVNQTSDILQTTGDGLDLISQVIKNVYTSTLYLDDTTNALAQTIQSTSLFIDSAGSFVGEDLINTITNTQRTLDTAQASALVIDNILTTLSRVPLIGINYNPSLPLNTALGEVSKSLDPLQESLKGFQSNLGSTRTDMQEFKDQLLILDQNISSINKNLASSQAVIDDYRTQVSILTSWADDARTSLPVWVKTIFWILTIIILWLVLIQVGILLQGISLLSRVQVNLEAKSDQ
ncbi:MAG: hypothetical protein A2Y53_08440 [Chloroflexi bacterium RBG_16_47_49]|nr:MAG: hypothetical protein A2Y53_08440 [Chloroflexi bacterium RBG_16_47_49]